MRSHDHNLLICYFMMSWLNDMSNQHILYIYTVQYVIVCIIHLKVCDDMSFPWCFFLAVISALPSLSTLWTMLKHRDLGDEIGVSPSHPICIGVSGVSHVRKLDLQAETWPSHLAHDKTEDCRGRAVGHAEHCFLELAWICLDFHAWTQPLDDAALLLKLKMHETDSTTPDAKHRQTTKI